MRARVPCVWVLARISRMKGERMIVWTQWYGGSSYACPLHSEPTHWERFKSMKQAKRVFASRSDFDPHFPCVGNDAEMQLYFFGPSEDVEPWKMRDPYPDRILTIGPRGGVRITRE